MRIVRSLAWPAIARFSAVPNCMAWQCLSTATSRFSARASPRNTSTRCCAAPCAPTRFSAMDAARSSASIWPGIRLAYGDDEHSCSAEAIADSQILVVRRATLLKVAERDLEVAKSLWALTAAELKRSQEHGLLLIKSAQERLVAFLLAMAQRLSTKNEVDLPMSRQDIADHLGLTIETVSRTFTQLADS